MQSAETIVCSRCLEISPQGKRFCSGCGAKLAGAEPPLDEISVATVLFADVADFTRMSTQLSLEQIKRLMDRVFEELFSIVRKYDGVVDKYIGDCLMAVFGVPLPKADDAARGVSAALDMQEAIALLRPKLEQEGLPPIRLRIGVDSGPVIAGPMGAGPQRRFTVMGPVVNRAAHLQAEGPLDSVIIGKDCQRRVRGIFRLAETTVEQKKAYIVNKERFSGKRLAPRHILGTAAGIVGRNDEVAALQHLYEKVKANKEAKLVLIVGEQGIGKSRLAFEFLAGFDSSNEEPYRLIASGKALTQRTPFALVAHFLRDYLGIASSHDQASHLQISEMLSQLELSPRQRDIQTLLAVLDPSTDEWQLESVSVFVQRVMDICARIVIALCKKRPTILIIENAHLIDSATLELIGYLKRRVYNLPLIILVLARPEFMEAHPQISHAEGVVCFKLDALNDAAIEAFMADALGPSAPLDLINYVISRSQGNPLKVEELLRSFEATGVVERWVDGWKVRQSRSLPAENQSIAALRFNGLSKLEQQLLGYAATIGRTFWYGALDDLWSDDLSLLFGQLIRKEFIVEQITSQLAGQLEYRFSSDELATVAYRELDEEARKGLHAQVAEWLAQRSEKEELAEERARHLERASLHEKAVETLEYAADSAYRSSDYNITRTLLDRALMLCDKKQKRFELLAKRERVLNTLGKWSIQRRDAEEMLELAIAEGNTSWEVEALLRVGRTLLNSGEYDSALTTFERSLEIATAQEDRERSARALRWIALLHFNQSQHQKALRYFEQALGLIESDADDLLAAELAYEMGVTIGTIGDYYRALKVSERALDLFKRQGNAYQEAFCLGNMGCFYIYLGAYSEAISLFRRAEALGRDIGAPLAEASAQANLGFALYLKGEHKDALELERRARSLAEEIGDMRLLADASLYEAFALLELDEPLALQAAESRAEAALTIAVEGKMRGSHAIAKMLVAKLHSKNGKVEDAYNAANEAIRLLDQIGSLEGFEEAIRLVFIELALSVDKEDEAKKRLRETIKALEEKASWIENASDRVRFLQLETNARLLALYSEMNLSASEGEP